MTVIDAPAPEVEDPAADHRRRVNTALDVLIEQRADLGLVIEFLAANAVEMPPYFTHHVSVDVDGGFKVGVVCGTADEMAAFTRLLARGARTPISKDANEKTMRVERRFGTAVLYGHCDRDQVCTAKVVGQETVEVPDPDAPKITVTRDVVVWECASILAGGAS